MEKLCYVYYHPFCIHSITSCAQMNVSLQPFQFWPVQKVELSPAMTSWRKEVCLIYSFIGLELLYLWKLDCMFKKHDYICFSGDPKLGRVSWSLLQHNMSLYCLFSCYFCRTMFIDSIDFVIINHIMISRYGPHSIVL